MKCTFVASSTYSYPSISSSSLPGSISSKGALLLLEAVPLLPGTRHSLRLLSRIPGTPGYLPAHNDTFSYLHISKQFPEGCQEEKVFLQTLRATDGSGPNPAVAQGPPHAAG